MIISAGILLAVLIVFTLGKSPVFRVDRAGAAIIGASLTVATGVLSFDEATHSLPVVRVTGTTGFFLYMETNVRYNLRGGELNQILKRSGSVANLAWFLAWVKQLATEYGPILVAINAALSLYSKIRSLLAGTKFSQGRD